MNKYKGKKVLIFQQRDWAKRIGQFIAKRLQEEGCKLSAVTLKRRTHDFITTQKNVKYEQVVGIDDIIDNPEKNLDGDDISLEEICRELNIDSVWPMLHSNRYLVRCYREQYYYGYRQNVPDEHIVAYIKAYYKKLRDLFASFKPDLVFIVAFISEEHLMLKLFADKYKIPVIAIADAKVPGYYVFAYDHMYRKGPLVDRFNELQGGGKESKNREKAKKFVTEFREKAKKPIYADSGKNIELGIIKRIRRELSPYKRIFDFYTKEYPRINHLKSIGPTIDYKPPKIILRDFYRHKQYAKFANSYKYYPLEKVKKFVFFPLKFTPEGNIDLMCPLYNNQIELARQIAMSLPDDYTLVVKEHWAMVGLRTPSYLEKVARTPNVKLVDYRIPADEVLKKCDMVISTYSTVLFEAAFYNKPAIMLSDAGMFNLLPNIFPHTNLFTLPKKIKEVLASDLRTDEYERQLENYIAAVYDSGFDYNYAAAWERGEESREELLKIYEWELDKWLCQKD